MPIKKRKTREERIDEIMAAAMKVFVSKGYNKTTMEDIIRKRTCQRVVLSLLYKYERHTDRDDGSWQYAVYVT